MRRRDAALLLCLVAAQPALAQTPKPAAPPSHAARPHPEFLVNTAWLAAHLAAPDVVVLHVGRTDSAYRAGHIPGARFLPLSAVATTVRGIPNEFPPRGDLVATFRDLGVGDSARIVIYGDDPGLFAARAWVALDLLGQSGRTSVLDGGLTRWTAEHRPTETSLRMSSMEPFTARWRADRVVTAAWVRSHLGDRRVVLVDARPADQYAGGHLPGAKSLFWVEDLVSRDDPVLKPMRTLHEELWQATGADAPEARTVVTYCLTGMQASHDYFVARYIGYPDVRLYDGSFSEWTSLRPAGDYPVERTGP
jgi:thiosulfate/3-mercaptopyruvate sulfurtransferase